MSQRGKLLRDLAKKLPSKDVVIENYSDDDDEISSTDYNSDSDVPYDPGFLTSSSESSEDESEAIDDLICQFEPNLSSPSETNIAEEADDDVDLSNPTEKCISQEADGNIAQVDELSKTEDTSKENKNRRDFHFEKDSPENIRKAVTEVVLNPGRLPFKLNDFTKSKVSKTNNTEIRRVWDKRELCIFCFDNVTNFSRHLTRKHSSELPVKQFMALPKKSIERAKMIDVLRKQGNFLSPASHEIKPVKRSKMDVAPTDLLPCVFCRGYYMKTSLRHHVKKCSMRPRRQGKFKAAQSQTLLASLSANSPFINKLRLKKEIFDTMNTDAISLTVKMDPLICSFGEFYMKRHKHKHLNVVTKNKLRELARLLIEAKKNMEVENLFELMNPENFDVITMSTKNIAGYNAEERKYKNAPSLALHMGTLLTQVCQHIFSLLLKRTEEFCINVDVPKKIVDIKSLLKLIRSNWNFEVSAVANQNLMENASEKPTIIPLTSDIKVLNDYAKLEASRAYELLKKNPKNTKAFVDLQNCCFVLTLTLNRRRVGELQRVPLKKYLQVQGNVITKEFVDSLKDTEKLMYKAFKRITIRGKKNSTVPVLFSRPVQTYLDFTNGIRGNFVPKTNEFLFATPKAESCINGSAVVVKFTEKCGAKYPKSLRSTKLRKHVASISQVYHLNAEEVDQLCSFMGHTQATHREFYRLPNEIYQTAKLAKFLLTSQNEDTNMDAELTSDEESDEEAVDDVEEESNEPIQPVEPSQPVTEQGESSNKENESNNSCEPGNVQSSQVSSENESDLDPIPKKKVRLSKTNKTSVKKSTENKSTPKENNKNNGKIQRVRWTTEQKQITTKHFKRNIENKKPPTESEIENFRKKNPVMCNKDWKKIKAFVFNAYK